MSAFDNKGKVQVAHLPGREFKVALGRNLKIFLEVALDNEELEQTCVLGLPVCDCALTKTYALWCAEVVDRGDEDNGGYFYSRFLGSCSEDYLEGIAINQYPATTHRLYRVRGAARQGKNAVRLGQVGKVPFKTS